MGRLRSAVPYLVLTLLLLGAYADPLFTKRTFFYRDTGMMRAVLGEARSGPSGHAETWPLWTHATANGRPLFANPAYALAEPTNVLFRVLPFEHAFELFLVLHVAIAGCAMALLARTLGTSGVAAFAAGAAYALGGGVVSGLTLYSTLPGLAWAPLVLAAAAAAAAGPTLPRIARLALAIGMVALAGQPEVLALAILAAAALAWALAPARPRRLVAGWLAALLVGAALAAPQLLPAALHARSTLRAAGFTTRGILYNSVQPLRALWLVVPGLGGNPLDARAGGGFPGQALLDGTSPYLLSIYAGIVTVALALAARDPSRRRLPVTLGALACLGVLLSLGRHLPGAEALVAALPFRVPLRFPEKALYLTFFCLPPLAARGIDRLRALPVPRLPVLLAACVVLDLLLAHRRSTPTIAVSELASPPLARELQERALALGIRDGQWRVHHQRQRDAGGWGPPSGSLPPTEEDFHRWQVRMLVPPLGAPYGIRAALDAQLDLLEDTRTLALVRAAYQAPRPDWAHALGEAGVLWVVSPEATLEEDTSGVLVREMALGPAEDVPPGSGYVYRNTGFVPRMRLEGSVESIVEDHSGWTATVVAVRAGLLEVSDTAGEIESWSARVDGRPAPVRLANRAFLAVPVPEGRHEVRLDCRSRGLAAGTGLCLAALLACGLALYLPSSRTSSRRRSSS